METKQKIEEGLSIIWEEREKKADNKQAIENRMAAKIGENIMGELERQDLVKVEGDHVKFTTAGEEKAKDITRRQRLAERLLIDVLELTRSEMDSSACEFEHILSKEVEESICTLLGHPRECPHGLPVPKGDCCLKAKELIESIVVPLIKLVPGQVGKIVYMRTHDHPELHRLMSFGVVPGVTISLHQTFPSFVIKVEETELALEKDVARGIFVKKMAAEPSR